MVNKVRVSLLVANWKLQGNQIFMQQWWQSFAKHYATLRKISTEVVILPPLPLIPLMQPFLQKTSILLGAQNMSNQIEGPYTGEISGRLLKELGCHYILIGHSERRLLYKETHPIIMQKLILADRIGLKPILCIGENQKAHDQGKTHAVLVKQLRPYLTFAPKFLEKLVIAYEPCWSIGTDKMLTPIQIQTIHAYLRQYLARHLGLKVAAKIRILYGGSVQPSNATALFKMQDIDGGLIGRASLNAIDFLKIFQSL